MYSDVCLHDQEFKEYFTKQPIWKQVWVEMSSYYVLCHFYQLSDVNMVTDVLQK
jgi:hypothetical protein